MRPSGVCLVPGEVRTFVGVTPRALAALLPLVGLVAFLLGTLLAFAARAALFGRPHTPDIEKRQHTILAKFFQEWWIWLWGPVERLCVRLGISPDAITLASTLVAAGAAVLLGFGWLSLGGWVFLFGASFDFIDGRVARATGRVTRAGAFLDSTLDRVGELLVFGGLAVTFRGSVVLFAALAAAGASLLVSYARARGEALGADEAARVGGMQRPERIVVTGVACALSPLADAAWGAGVGRAVVGSALAALAALATATAARRTFVIYRALRRADPAVAPRPPFRLADVFRLDATRRRKAAR
ncbi:CDP-alcohol phosphatidyltransferase [Anaeromyxobacter dehalogenans 2CP-C]|uniref:CDP-alcohol phosphatidyltransferase n=1 Tax=Anaeromyxobacter dehalogenans (strain 2CP-C) TaxID=290397 RepID=Q2ILU3_ANADE|nr:CDP-alcohol phosphatidyltransferase [Anaeromyxobacter dehalogenans 2CP-C]